MLHPFFSITGVSRKTMLLLALAGVLSGAANALLLAIVGETLRGNANWPLPAMATLFAASAVACVALQRYSQARTARMTEEAGARIRLRVLSSAFKASLTDSERIDHHLKRLVLSGDAAQVASALPTLLGMMSSAATVFCALAYLCWLSPLACAAVCVVIALAVMAYQALIGHTHQHMKNAHAENDRAFAFVDDLLQGHKELKLDAEWAHEFVTKDLVPSIRHSSRLLGNVRAAQQDVGLVGVVAFVLLLGMATFVSPLLGLPAPLMVNALMVVLFIQAHIHGIVQRLPGLLEMSNSLGRIRRLIDDLRQGRERVGPPLASAPAWADWKELRLRDLSYRYGAEGTKFQVDRVNLTLQCGQIVFIVGGNGSGKTTLAKLLVGLYAPTSGEILLDGVRVDDANRVAYRQSFNAVFSDVHLFRRRVSDVLFDSTSSVGSALSDMAVHLAVSDDNRLDVKPYSQGQRKRLASALALASDKPMCMFDEWTADQDPEFRAYFYTRYLPSLKLAGKTVFVISHDDQYFNHADVIIRMDGGRLVSAAPVQPGTLRTFADLRKAG